MPKLNEPAVRERAIARRALGETLRGEIESLLDRTKAPRTPSGPPICLHDANARFDLGLAWWRPTTNPIAQAIIDLEQLDFTSSSVVGKGLRPLAQRFLSAAEAVEAFIAFLDEFDELSVPGRLADNLRANIGYVSHRFLELTDARPDGDHGLQAFVDEGELEAETFILSNEVLEEIEARDLSVSREEVLETALQQRPSNDFRHYAELASAFTRDPDEQAVLAHRQLRLIADAPPRHDIANWLTQAARVALNPFPLLAHRVSVLTYRLIERAYERDTEAAASLFVGFNQAQVGRIISNGQEAQTLLEASQAGDDRALVESYKKLAEGLLRPFGALVVHLHAISEGRDSPSLSVRPLLGELEDNLRATETELGRLLTIGLLRPIRNAAAHEDVVVDTAGAVSVVDSDGQLTAISMVDVSYSRAVLEAALVGVDIATGAAVWTHLEPATGGIHLDWTRAAQTAGALEQMATTVAQHVFGGYVTRLIPEGESLSLTLHGEPTRLQTIAFFAGLDNFLHDRTKNVLANRPNGDRLVEYSRLHGSATPKFSD